MLFQYLLREQFPNIFGLLDPLLQITRGFDVHGLKEFVQCLNVRNCHWITISTVGMKPNKVEVFDSLESQLSASAVETITTLLHTQENSFTIKYTRVQQQNGSSDCGFLP